MSLLVYWSKGSSFCYGRCFVCCDQTVLQTILLKDRHTSHNIRYSIVKDLVGIGKSFLFEPMYLPTKSYFTSIQIITNCFWTTRTGRGQRYISPFFRLVSEWWTLLSSKPFTLSFSFSLPWIHGWCGPSSVLWTRRNLIYHHLEDSKNMRPHIQL